VKIKLSRKVIIQMVEPISLTIAIISAIGTIILGIIHIIKGFESCSANCESSSCCTISTKKSKTDVHDIKNVHLEQK
jgi:hypothetical protein